MQIRCRGQPITSLLVGGCSLCARSRPRPAQWRKRTTRSSLRTGQSTWRSTQARTRCALQGACCYLHKSCQGCCSLPLRCLLQLHPFCTLSDDGEEAASLRCTPAWALSPCSCRAGCAWWLGCGVQIMDDKSLIKKYQKEILDLKQELNLMRQGISHAPSPTHVPAPSPPHLPAPSPAPLLSPSPAPLPASSPAPPRAAPEAEAPLPRAMSSSNTVAPGLPQGDPASADDLALLREKVRPLVACTPLLSPMLRRLV